MLMSPYCSVRFAMEPSACNLIMTLMEPCENCASRQGLHFHFSRYVVIPARLMQIVRGDRQELRMVYPKLVEPSHGILGRKVLAVVTDVPDFDRMDGIPEFGRKCPSESRWVSQNPKSVVGSNVLRHSQWIHFRRQLDYPNAQQMERARCTRELDSGNHAEASVGQCSAMRYQPLHRVCVEILRMLPNRNEVITAGAIELSDLPQ